MKLHRVLKWIVRLPVLLMALVVLYEVVGLAVNHAASAQQTRDIVRTLRAGLSQVEIVDRYTETGNTAGTGNHVDMLSAVILRTESGWEEIIKVCQKYDGLDEWSFWVKSMEEVKAAREKYPGIYPFLEEMAVPGGAEDCWLLYMNTSAPFVNNIEGD